MKRIILTIIGLISLNLAFANNFAAPPSIMPRTENAPKQEGNNLNSSNTQEINNELPVGSPFGGGAANLNLDGSSENKLEIVNESGENIFSIEDSEIQVEKPVNPDEDHTIIFDEDFDFEANQAEIDKFDTETKENDTDEPADFSQGVPTVEKVDFRVLNQNAIEVSFEEITGVDTYFILYGTESVVDENDIYNMPAVDTLGSSKFELDNLESGVDYFLSVVAKSGELYSEFLSEEISFQIDENNFKNPNFKDVKAINTRVISITFDSDMNFENLDKDNFEVIDTFNESNLEILSVRSINSKSLNLLVNKLQSGFEYELKSKELVSEDDLEMLEANNTFVFRAEELAEINELKVDKVEVLDHNGVEITLNDELINELNTENVSLVLKSDPNTILEIKDILVKPTNNKQYLIVSEDLKDEEFQYIFKDLDGLNFGGMTAENSTVEFRGVNPPVIEQETTELPDNIAPANVRNLDARFIDDALSMLEINFDSSVDTDQDLDKYELYLAKDSDNYFYFGEISKDQELPLTIEEVDLPEEFINIKVTSKDLSNNESLGEIYKLLLPETGPAGLLAVMGLSIFGSLRLTRRKK